MQKPNCNLLHHYLSLCSKPLRSVALSNAIRACNRRFDAWTPSPLSFSLSALHCCQDLCDLSIQGCKIHGQDALPRMQDQIYRLSQATQMTAQRGAHTAPDPVPLHSSTQNFSDSETHPRAAGSAALKIKGHHVVRKMLPALLVNRLKIGMLQQS